MAQTTMPPSLYEQDYPAWLDLTLAQLKSQDFGALDWVNLIEEIEELGREQRHKVESYLLRLLIHLLLYEYWQAERPWSGKGWEKEIDNFRLELDFLLESQVLCNYFLSILEKSYAKARKWAIRKSNLPPLTFPETCPYSSEKILDFGWLPPVISS
ncbi:MULTISPECIES: DUF29 domain-containing protein [unclassified Synechocystis]|uniref:DUF29 domain-containing protein n=1 Tax=unclassified Synechocystis TaxID=2640012 RepID=UPI001BAF8E42|nr:MULTISPECIES: DUF29 domain-containing protein [unclassified Synechocystis]